MKTSDNGYWVFWTFVIKHLPQNKEKGCHAQGPADIEWGRGKEARSLLRWLETMRRKQTLPRAAGRQLPRLKVMRIWNIVYKNQRRNTSGAQVFLNQHVFVSPLKSNITESQNQHAKLYPQSHSHRSTQCADKKIGSFFFSMRRKAKEPKRPPIGSYLKCNSFTPAKHGAVMRENSGPVLIEWARDHKAVPFFSTKKERHAFHADSAFPWEHGLLNFSSHSPWLSALLTGKITMGELEVGVL